MLLLSALVLAGPHELSFAGPGVVEDTWIDSGSSGNHAAELTLELKANVGSDLRHTLLQIPDLIGGTTSQLPADATVDEAWLTLTSSGSKPEISTVGELLPTALIEPWDAATATWEEASTGVPWTSDGAGRGSQGHACGMASSGSGNAVVIDMVPCLSPYLDSGISNGWLLGFEDGDKVALSFASTDLGATVPTLWVSFQAVDADVDGFWAGTAPGYDCNDSSAAVNPAAEEIPGNAVDDDCDPATTDGTTDTGTPAETGDTGRPPGLAVDDDGDRYASDLDCDDHEPDVYPGHVEWCDKADNNCNGIVDEDCETAAATEPGCGCSGVAGPGWLSAVLVGTALGRRRRR